MGRTKEIRDEALEVLGQKGLTPHEIDFSKVAMINPLELFALPEFREDPCIRERCQRIGPMWTTTDPLPGGHFGNYFGLLGVRSYDNPHVGNLYAVHETTHLMHFCYSQESDAEASFCDWSRAMLRSEFRASLESECLIYFRIPGLRGKTFKHEIWVDRYLNSRRQEVGEERAALPLFPADAEYRQLEAMLAKQRKRAMRRPGISDPLKHQLAHYFRTNYDWCALWAEPVGYGPYKDEPAFRVVERHMRKLRSTYSGDEAHDFHMKWLEDVTPRFGVVLVPFAYQAVKYAPKYREMVERFGNGVYLR